MAKGSIAKTVVVEKISEAFGKNFLGERDKKVYVLVEENGEVIQVAISLTCPKTPVPFEDYELPESNSIDFEEVTTEITEEARENMASLMQKLGI